MGSDERVAMAAGGDALAADMAAGDGYRIVLERLAVAANTHLPGAIEGADPVHLHQLRVAVRRTRAVLADAKPVLAARAIAEARDGFARIGRITGPARDLDVHTASWALDVEQLGSDVADRLEPATELLRVKRDEARRAMIDELRSDGTRVLFERWQELLHDDWSTALAKGGRRRLGTVVARRIETAHAGVVERGRLIDDHAPAADLHELRKDVKAVRYLVECFDGLSDERPRRYAKRLRRLQTVLGAHQDADMHLIVVERIADELHADGATAPTILALGRMTERLMQRRAAARARFVDQWALFDDAATEERLDALLAALIAPA